MSLTQDIRTIALSQLDIAMKYRGFDRIPADRKLFAADPVWSLFGMATAEFLRYRYVGNYYTSIFRKMGDMYELFTQRIIGDCLKLTPAQMTYTYALAVPGATQQRSLDARVALDDIADPVARKRIVALFDRLAPRHMEKAAIEVRCCYQIGDSKRIQADVHAATHARAEGYLPIMLVFCSTSLPSPVARLSAHWHLFEGPHAYRFLHELTDFDLFGTLRGLQPELEAKMRKVIATFSQ